MLEQQVREAAEAMAQRRAAFGQRIKAARDSKGWKQKELAAAVHVEPVTVSRWENGVHLPELATLQVIAEKLDKPLGYFTEALEGLGPYGPDTDNWAAALEARMRSMEETVQRLEQAVTELRER
jgi:transcriptional regulator with XRE-family HTH domain